MATTARERITPKKKKSEASPTVNVDAPTVVVDVPPAQITVDTQAVADGLERWCAHVDRTISTMAQAIVELAREQNRLAEAISSLKPTVNVPARPRAFHVELERDEETGAIEGMRIASNGV